MALRAQPAAEQAKTVAAHEADEKPVALRAQLHTPLLAVSLLTFGAEASDRISAPVAHRLAIRPARLASSVLSVSGAPPPHLPHRPRFTGSSR